MVVWYTGGGEEGKEGGEGEEGKEGGRRGAGPAARSPEQGRRAPGERRRQIEDEASRHQTRGESGERSATQRRGDLECEARVRVRGGPQRRLHFITRGGLGEPGEGACWASQWAVGAPGRLFGPGRARAVPRARVAAQARPGHSGRAGLGPVATVPCRSWAGQKHRTVGRAASPRAAWPSIAASHSFVQTNL